MSSVNMSDSVHYDNDLSVNKDYFPVLLGSKIIRSFNRHHVWAVALHGGCAT